MFAIRLLTKTDPPDASAIRRTDARSASEDLEGSRGSPVSGMPHAANSGSPSTGIGNIRSRSARRRP